MFDNNNNNNNGNTNNKIFILAGYYREVKINNYNKLS